MSNSPITENLIFPAGIDSFPTVYDSGNSSVPERYTKLWAEYFNKLRRFVGVMEPLISPNSASSDGSLTNLAMFTLSPAPTLNHVLRGFSDVAYDAGKSPPTQILPFEVVITSSSDYYGNWPTIGGGTTPLLYYSSTANLNKIMGNTNFYNLRPMAQCTLRRGTNIPVNKFCTRWIINSYCIAGTDTLLIRGSFLDLNAGAPFTTGLPPLDSSGHFPDGDDHYLNITIVGVRT